MITNPYRNPAPFDLESISGRDVWLDASDQNSVLDASLNPITIDNTELGRWDDMSGSGPNASPQNIPLPVKKLAFVNGLDAVDTTPNGHFSMNAGPNYLADFDIFGVFTRLNTGVKSIMCGDSSNHHPFLWNHFNVIEVRFFDGGFAQDPGGVNLDTGTFLFNTNRDVSNNVSVKLNGSQIISTSNSSNMNINRIARSYSNWFHTGSMCELLLFGNKLSAEDNSNVETYLANKWGVTI